MVTDVAFLVMELVDGQPLSDQLARREPTTSVESCPSFDQAAGALGAAHDLGIVHRDVKPGNLMITPDGRVKVTDFGIARAIDSADITEVGQVIGTARYMSPEQARGEAATPASDVYALAVIGYEMLSGRTPFDGETPVAIALAHVQSAPSAAPAIGARPTSITHRTIACQAAGPATARRRRVRGCAPPDRHRARHRQPSRRDLDRGGRAARQPNRTSDLQPTAVFEHPATDIHRVPMSTRGDRDRNRGRPSPDRRHRCSLMAGSVRNVADVVSRRGVLGSPSPRACCC